MIPREDTKVHEGVLRRDPRGVLREVWHEGGVPMRGSRGKGSKGIDPKTGIPKGDLREPEGVPVGVPGKGIPRGTTKHDGHQNFQFGHMKCPCVKIRN